jgi:uncharacterized membrane protein
MTIGAEISLLLATLLCSLVAGFLFAFAVVIMPGIGSFDDREFLRSFQRIDGVIQRGDPLFGLVWVGSILAVIAAVVLGLGEASGSQRALLALAGGLYLLGVQAPTFIINVPLNNELRDLDIDGTDDAALGSFREHFERRWNASNRARTLLAVVSAGFLLQCTNGW